MRESEASGAVLPSSAMAGEQSRQVSRRKRKKVGEAKCYLRIAFEDGRQAGRQCSVFGRRERTISSEAEGGGGKSEVSRRWGGSINEIPIYSTSSFH